MRSKLRAQDFRAARKAPPRLTVGRDSLLLEDLGETTGQLGVDEPGDLVVPFLPERKERGDETVPYRKGGELPDDGREVLRVIAVGAVGYLSPEIGGDRLMPFALVRKRREKT